MSEDNEKDILSKRMNQFKKIKNESNDDANYEGEINEIDNNLIDNIIGEDFDVPEAESDDINYQEDKQKENPYVIENINIEDEEETVIYDNIETQDIIEGLYDEDSEDNEEDISLGSDKEEIETTIIEIEDEPINIQEESVVYDNIETQDIIEGLDEEVLKDTEIENKPKSLLEKFVLNSDNNKLSEDILDGKVSNEREFINIEDELEDDLTSVDETELALTDSDVQEEANEEEPEDLMDDLLADADELLKEHKQMVENELQNVSEDDEVEVEDEPEPESEPESEALYSDEEIAAKRNVKKPLFNKESFIKISVGVVFIAVIVVVAIFARKLLNGNSNQPPSKTNVNTTVTETPTPQVTTSPEDVKIVDDILDDLESNEDKEPSTEDSTVEDLGEPETNEETTVTDTETSSFIQNFKGYIVDINETEIYISDLSYDKYTELTKDFDTYKKDSKDATDNQIILDYDYSLNETLKTIVYKEFSILDLSEIPTWATIGSEVSVVYLQDKESLLNELIEIEKYEEVDNTEGTIINPKDEENAGNEDSSTEESSNLGDNVWGDDWNSIVAKINDRRTKENSETSNNGSVLDLENLELKESVTANIQIGNASIVWFKIGWKTNKDVKDVPNLEDVAVELQTANGSLVNDSNIKKYGKKWVSEDKTINFVIKNTTAGNWGVVFTKDVGTYLGDVTIQAVPITGFLQIINADATYTDGKLKVIWNAGGVKDDNCKVQVYARNGSKDVLMYSGNSIDDGIHTVDMVEIDASKIAGNTYDIIIKITDIDATASTPKSISATYITDIKTIEGIEVPAIK